MRNFRRQIKIWAMGMVVVLGLVVMAPRTALAWGPQRPTFTLKKPAGYVTFNSITDNPVVGDERNFVRVREDGAVDYVDKINVRKGKRYIIYVAYHNNAASNLNPSGKGIARGTRVRGVVPKVIKKGEKGKIAAVISADNAEPKAVWDEAWLDALEDVELEYESESAIIHTKAKDKTGKSVDGQKLTGLLSEKGALIGVNALDGMLPGCAEFSGHITFAVKTKAGVKPPEPTPEPKSEGKLLKEVSTDGKNYSSEVVAKEGDKVYYKVTFTNTGETELTEIKLRDEMAKGMKLVKGSVKVIDGEGRVEVKNFENFEEVVVPRLAVGKQVQITYVAEVVKVECGQNSYENVMRVEYGWKGAKFPGKIEKRATVKIDKKCDTPPDNPEEPEDPEPTPPDDPTPPPDPVPEIPETGPAEIAIFAVVALGIAGGAGYFVQTRRKLKRAEQSVGVGRIGGEMKRVSETGKEGAESVSSEKEVERK